mmetsp:Transcript_42151/g.125073  ORF Transcript_42151/g.125073 Transcript_42151/m.125073 type:complete len:220 (-) Transcript_42151:584-1243(-)
MDALASRRPPRLLENSSSSRATRRDRCSFFSSLARSSTAPSASWRWSSSSTTRLFRSPMPPSRVPSVSQSRAMASEGVMSFAASLAATVMGTFRALAIFRLPGLFGTWSRCDAGTGPLRASSASMAFRASPPCRRCAPTFICRMAHSSASSSSSSGRSPPSPDSDMLTFCTISLMDALDFPAWPPGVMPPSGISGICLALPTRGTYLVAPERSSSALPP